MTNGPSRATRQLNGMTRPDHKRSLSQISAKINKPVTSLRKMPVWGNHSATQYPDLFQTEADGKKVWPTINDQAWLETNFIPTVQKRGTAIITARGLSSAASAASAAIDHMRDWARGTADGDWVSMGLPAHGSAGIAEGVISGHQATPTTRDYPIDKATDTSAFSSPLV